MSKKPPASDQHETSSSGQEEAAVGDQAGTEDQGEAPVSTADKSKDKASDKGKDKDKDKGKDESNNKSQPVAADDANETAGTEPEETTEVLATDPDPVQIGKVAAADMTETRRATSPETPVQPENESRSEPAAEVVAPTPPPKRGFPWFGLFNLVLILALAAAAWHYWNLQQTVDAAHRAEIADLQLLVDQLDKANKANDSLLQSRLLPLKGDIDAHARKLDELGLGQQDLRASSEKLYELYGRDKNGWQLAEVQYLMHVAQHKLILQDDFEGAAITLQAASDRIGLTGDPGLLPVRVMISEEIADLKTRRRADLVGMTLVLAQLGRQVRGLQPGFALRVEETPEAVYVPAAEEDWLGRFNEFFNSLISIRKESSDPTVIEANIVDVASALEDNLKLARWAVLERDARQYQLLLGRSLQLFREFYDLDNAANQDFMSQLQELEKMVIKPEKPDITGSLRELQRILSQREIAPQPAAEPAPEAVDG